MRTHLDPEAGDLLVLVDIQNDFCRGGALAVPDGDAVVPLANDLIHRFKAAGAGIVLTQDWHPAGHSSFASGHPGRVPYDMVEMSYGPQTLWPDHCVQGTAGAEFHPDLLTAAADMVVRKGFRPAIDSYSAFFENDGITPTGLTGYCRERGFRRLFFAGLALDYCVSYSAEDSARCGFQPVVIEDACRAIDMNGSLDQAIARMNAIGVQFTRAAYGG